MDKLYQTVIVGDNFYKDTILPKEMTDHELLKAIAPVEIPKLRAEIKRLVGVVTEIHDRCIMENMSGFREIHEICHKVLEPESV